MVFSLKKFRIIIFSAILVVFYAFLARVEAKNSYLDENFTVNIRRNNDGFIEKFMDWSIYKVKRYDKNYCYALSMPISSTGTKFRRGRAYFVVSNLLDSPDEITLVSGFYYRKNSDVELSFGAKKFYLLTHKSRAWAYLASDDLDIIKEMQQNADFVISAFTDDGKFTEDRFSLIGFKQAYFKLKEICKEND
jgi:hypothetical protein